MIQHHWWNSLLESPLAKIIKDECLLSLSPYLLLSFSCTATSVVVLVVIRYPDIATFALAHENVIVSPILACINLIL